MTDSAATPEPERPTEALTTSAPPVTSQSDPVRETTSAACSQPMWSAKDDERQAGECLAPAVRLAYTTSGRWEPRCDRHSRDYPADRVRTLPDV